MLSRKSPLSRNGKYAGETNKSAILTGTLESSENSSSSSTVEPKLIEIVDQHFISSLAFFVDGKHFVSSSWDGKIRRWRTEGDREVGMPMDAGSVVYNLAVSRDGKWIVSGTHGGELAMHGPGCRELQIRLDEFR